MGNPFILHEMREKTTHQKCGKFWREIKICDGWPHKPFQIFVTVWYKMWYVVQSERTLDLRWPGSHARAHQKPAIRDTAPFSMFHSLHNHDNYPVNHNCKNYLTKPHSLNGDYVTDDEGGMLDYLLVSDNEDNDEDNDEDIDEDIDEGLDVGGNENGPMKAENAVEENEKVPSQHACSKGKEVDEDPSRAPFQANAMEALQKYAEAPKDMTEGRPQPTDWKRGYGVYWCRSKNIGFIQEEESLNRLFVNVIDIAPGKSDDYKQAIINLFYNQARGQQIQLKFRRISYYNKKEDKWLTKCTDVDVLWSKRVERLNDFESMGRAIEIENDNAGQMSRRPTVGEKRSFGNVTNEEDKHNNMTQMAKKKEKKDVVIPHKVPLTVPGKPLELASLMRAYNKDALLIVQEISAELKLNAALLIALKNDAFKEAFLHNIDPLRRLGMTSKSMNRKCETLVAKILLTTIRDCDPFERPDIQRMAQDKVRHGNKGLFSTWVLLECIRERQAWVGQGNLLDMKNDILQVPYDDTLKKIKLILLKWAGNRQNMCTVKMVFREIDWFVEGMAMRGQLYDSSTPQTLLKQTWDDTVDLLLLFGEYVFKTGSEEFEFDDWFEKARVGDLGAFVPGDEMNTSDEEIYLKKFKPLVVELQSGRLVFDHGNEKTQNKISPKQMWMQKLRSWSFKLLVSLFDMIKMTKKANTPRMTKAWKHNGRVAKYFKLTQMILVTRLFGEEIGLVCVHVLGCMVEQYPESMNLLERKKNDLQKSLIKTSSGDMEEKDEHSYTYAWGMRASKMILDMMRDYNFHKKTEQWIVLMEALRKIEQASRSLGRAPYFKFGK